MTNPSLSPLLKWAGGKRSEIPVLKPSYPSGVNRVIEPFAGGAAVSLEWNPDKIILGDTHEGLIRFYKSLQDESVRDPMLVAVEIIDQIRKRIGKMVDDWDAGQVAEFFLDPARITQASLDTLLADLTLPAELEQSIRSDLVAQAKDKALKRIPALEKKHDKVFDLEELKNHAETSLQSGLYVSLRRIFNGKISVNDSWSVAAWWVVRSLCYSGMFRYARNGDFNVPYGGIGYNSRDFIPSILHARNKSVLSFFSRAELYCLDFDAVCARYFGFVSTDFVFVDPPYDSAFSKYSADDNFDSHAQKRLANTLDGLKCPWMLVIKLTPMIRSLYEGRGLHMGVFGKTYGANFRNRHARGVEHLVVTNYPLTFVQEGEPGLRPLL